MPSQYLLTPWFCIHSCLTPLFTNTGSLSISKISRYVHLLLVFPHPPLFVAWEYRPASFNRCAMHGAWGLGFSVLCWHMGEQGLEWDQLEAAVLGKRLLHKSTAHVVCFYTSSSSSNSEIIYRNVSSRCRTNCFMVSSRHPEDKISLGFF